MFTDSQEAVSACRKKKLFDKQSLKRFPLFNAVYFITLLYVMFAYYFSSRPLFALITHFYHGNIMA